MDTKNCPSLRQAKTCPAVQSSFIFQLFLLVQWRVFFWKEENTVVTLSLGTTVYSISKRSLSLP